MKFLLINNRHFPGGGTETVYFNMATLLREAGHEVVFFSFQDCKNIPCNQDPFFLHKGGKIKQLLHYFYNKEAARKLDLLLKKEQPEIAHLHLFWGGMSPSILVVLKKHKIPIVHTVHEYRMICPAYLFKDGNGRLCERCKGGRFYQCTIHRCSKGSFIESFIMTMEIYFRNKFFHPANYINGFIFVSNFTRNKHIEFDRRFLKANLEVMYNFPNEIIHSLSKRLPDTFNSYYLYYGRLSGEKGIATLIRAFEKFPQLQLKIVGNGPLEAEMKQLCSDKGIANIEFLGFKTGKDLFELVANAKYVCVPSECYENNPMTIVESYTLCTPVIGAELGGIAEIVEDERTGFLFRSGSVDSLSKAISSAEELERARYLSQKINAFSFAEKNFNRNNYLIKLLEFYNNVIKDYYGGHNTV